MKLVFDKNGRVTTDLEGAPSPARAREVAADLEVAAERTSEDGGQEGERKSANLSSALSGLIVNSNGPGDAITTGMEAIVTLCVSEGIPLTTIVRSISNVFDQARTQRDACTALVTSAVRYAIEVRRSIGRGG